MDASYGDHAKWSAIVSRTPAAVKLAGLGDFNPTSMSLRGIGASLRDVGLAAKRTMPIKRTDMLTAEHRSNVLSKCGFLSFKFGSYPQLWPLSTISDAKTIKTTAKIAAKASFRILP